MTRLAIIGGDAGGMSCAALAKRRDPSLDIVVFERGPYTSYSACGIPYFVGGWIAEAHDLVIREPERFRAEGIEVCMETEVLGIDLDARRLTVRSAEGERTEGFDQLLYATGGEAVVPDIPGAREATEPLKTIPAAERFRRRIASEHGGRRTVVVGAGYIGLEIAEALVHRGYDVTLVEALPQVFPSIDPDMAEHVQRAAEREGIDVRTGVRVQAIEHDDGAPRAVVTDDGTIEAAHVIVAVGTKPAIGLAREADLPIGDAGGIRVDDRQSCGDGVWAAGDCVESWHRLLERHAVIALGTHANRHGKVAAANITGGDARFLGVIGTAVSRICEAEIGRTGLSEREATDAGIPYVTETIESWTKARYMPGAERTRVKVLAAPGDGRLLGAQIVGGDGSAKRIDVFATAIWSGMSAAEVAEVDLSYAPPFSGVFDPVALAARAVAKQTR